ncbi:MAG: methylated-DNA--[protein]-cysteine S-methyltransferase [Leptospirillia bacterium]
MVRSSPSDRLSGALFRLSPPPPFRGGFVVTLGEDGWPRRLRIAEENPAKTPDPPLLPPEHPLEDLFRRVLSGSVVYIGPLPAPIHPFDREVLETIRRIPYGATVSYADVARAIGRPKAARAVGGALSRNPLPLLLPCHRVIRASGEEGGYSGGAGHKRRLLEWERARKRMTGESEVFRKNKD